MKHPRRGSKEPLLIDPDFIEALDEHESNHRASSDRQIERKTQQLCRQVQRALNFALAESRASDGIDGLYIEEVAPAPDCGRLLVYVICPDDRTATDVMAALGRLTPRLRSEVASAITRKRAPELFFVPAYPNPKGGGGHE